VSLEAPTEEVSVRTVVKRVERFPVRARAGAPSRRLVCIPAVLLASLTGTHTLAAQVVRGTLLDDLSGQQILAGTVSLWTGDRVQVAETGTDRGGAFVLHAVRPGTYRLRAERPGFVPVVSSAMELKEGDTIQVQVVMSKSAVVLNPVVVKARPRRTGRPLDGYYIRLDQRLSGGRFITREELDRSRAGRTTDVLRRVPGVQLAPAPHSIGSNVVVNGCSPTVIVDGSPTPLLSGLTIDDLLKPWMLEGIEVYPSAAEAPAEYAMYVGRCGVILLWTRAVD
jgi:hypothetical protein